MPLIGKINYAVRNTLLNNSGGTPPPGYRNNKELLYKSSKVARNLGLFLIVVLLYLLTATAGVSDLELVMQNKGVHLPFFSINLQLNTFMYVAPLLVLVIHLYLLLSLLKHSVKLYSWLKLEKENLPSENQTRFEQRLLHPFLFNYVVAKKSDAFLFIAKLLVNFVAFFLPMMTLFYIEYRFSDLHDLGLTSYHFTLFIADALMVALFYPAIFLPKLKSNTWKQKIKRLVTAGMLPHKALVYIRKKIKLKTLPTLSLTRLLDQLFFWALLFVSVLYLFVISLITDGNKYKILVAYQRGDSWSIIKKLYIDSAYHAFYDSGYVPGETPIKRTLIPIPTISINSEKIGIYKPNLQEILQAKQNHYNIDLLTTPYLKGIDLQKRDFTMASFKNCELVNAQLDGSKLMYCNLMTSTLINAHMVNTNLYKARLENANLKGTIKNPSLP